VDVTGWARRNGAGDELHCPFHGESVYYLESAGGSGGDDLDELDPLDGDDAGPPAAPGAVPVDVPRPSTSAPRDRDV